MKRIITLTAVLSLLLIATLLVSGCGTILVTKNGETTGEIETRQYDFNDFTRVDIGSAFHYEIKQSDTYGVSITANSNLFDDVKVAQEGQMLIIGIEYPEAPWAIQINTLPDPTAVISMPQLDALDSSGATRGIVIGFGSSGELGITASGASRLELEDITVGNAIFDASGSSKISGDIEAENMELKISGASTVRLKGSTATMATDVSGSSHLELADLKAKDVSIILSGASRGTVSIEGKLDVELSGSSTLEYIGEPALGTTDITGASKLKRK